MPRLRRHLPHGCLAALAAWISAPACGQSSFDSPPITSDSPRPAPAVRGLFDPSQPAPTPTGRIGVAGAPAATFDAPTPQAPADAAIAPSGFDGSVASQARLLEGSTVLARVDGQVVMVSDVMWQVNQIIALNQAKVGIPPEQLEPLRQHLLRQQVMALIETKLLYADFRRTAPAENLPQIEAAIVKPFEETEVPRLVKMLKVKDRDELETLLRNSGSSLKDVRRQFVEKTIAGEWLRQRTPKPKPVTHEEMLAYYQDHLKEYEHPAQVRWEELMVRFDRSGGDRDAAWRSLAELGNEVWAAAAANPGLRGPVFAVVAKAKSHGFTAAEGGIHKWTTLGALKCEAINEALRTLAVGQMSDGIESDQGFHIVRVLERKEAGRSSFADEQAAIRKILEDEQRQELFVNEFAELRKSARVWTLFDGDVPPARLAELLDPKSKR